MTDKTEEQGKYRTICYNIFEMDSVMCIVYVVDGF